MKARRNPPALRRAGMPASSDAAANSANEPQPPAEPILDMDDIQGIAVPGFFKPYQTLICIRIPPSREKLLAFRSFLREPEAKPSNAQETLADRRLHRESPELLEREPAKPLLAVSLSYRGLLRLTPGAKMIPSPAFRGGMVARSSLLGDPTDETSEGHPSKWIIGGAGAELDALMVVGGDDADSVSTKSQGVVSRLLSAGCEISVQIGHIREDARGHEHFGFDDGVSQPGIRGRASQEVRDFITDRWVDLDQIPAAWLNGYPGQQLVWPGEFVIGYPASSPDPLVPGPVDEARPAWTRNGSFLVFRRLRQDVGLFWRTMKSEAERLATLPGFEGMKYERLAALLVGRWQSGAPVNRVPDGDEECLGGDQYSNNHFRFDSNTPKLNLRKGKTDPYPDAKADPVGLTCPWAAHIRKMNVRDSASDLGGTIASYSRRILRVGVPFGESLADPFASPADDPHSGDRGLLFLSIQSSIEEQVEFLQARWANDPSRPKMPGGHDFIIGQNSAVPDGIRKCVIFGKGAAQAEVMAPSQFVIPTGGGYFFVPSLSAIRDVIAPA